MFDLKNCTLIEKTYVCLISFTYVVMHFIGFNLLTIESKIVHYASMQCTVELTKTREQANNIRTAAKVVNKKWKFKRSGEL